MYFNLVMFTYIFNVVGKILFHDICLTFFVHIKLFCSACSLAVSILVQCNLFSYSCESMLFQQYLLYKVISMFMYITFPLCFELFLLYLESSAGSWQLLGCIKLSFTYTLYLSKLMIRISWPNFSYLIIFKAKLTQE